MCDVNACMRVYDVTKCALEILKEFAAYINMPI